LKETDDAYVAKVELPGLEKDDIHIEVSNDVLTISGERKHETDEKKEGWHRVERRYGKFSRAIRVPGDLVEADKITANYKNGVLEVTLPKAPQVKPKQIPVETN
jgi:HSP20 family protein